MQFPEEVVQRNESIPHINLSDHASVGGYVEICVTNVHSPYKFYMFLRKYKIKLQKLTNSLKAFYEKYHNNYGIPFSKITSGIYCAILFKKAAWHRVQVTEVFEYQVVVNHIDFGIHSVVMKEELNYLHKDFANLPGLAIEGELAAIESCEWDKEWSSKAITRFCSLTINKDLIAGVVDIDYNKPWMSVALTDTNNSKEIHICDTLTEEGYARFMGEEKEPCMQSPFAGKRKSNQIVTDKRGKRLADATTTAHPKVDIQQEDLLSNNSNPGFSEDNFTIPVPLQSLPPTSNISSQSIPPSLPIPSQSLPPILPIPSQSLPPTLPIPSQSLPPTLPIPSQSLPPTLPIPSQSLPATTPLQYQMNQLSSHTELMSLLFRSEMQKYEQGLKEETRRKNALACSLLVNDPKISLLAQIDPGLALSMATNLASQMISNLSTTPFTEKTVESTIEELPTDPVEVLNEKMERLLTTSPEVEARMPRGRVQKNFIEAVEIEKKTIHVIFYETHAHVFVDELIYYFTQFSGKTIVNKILEVKGVKFIYTHVKRENNELLFAELDKCDFLFSDENSFDELTLLRINFVPTFLKALVPNDQHLQSEFSDLVKVYI